MPSGCTGNQGGGALAALLPEANAGKLLVRGISRNADSAKAKALQAHSGVEIVAGDLGDRESLVKVRDVMPLPKQQMPTVARCLGSVVICPLPGCGHLEQICC